MAPFWMLLIVGCGGASARDPSLTATLVRYGDALGRGDAGEAYDLEHPLAHAGRSREDQARMAETARAELAELGSAIARAEGSSIAARAHIALTDGPPVALVRDAEGRWAIAGGALQVPSLVTPTDAVSALRAALARRDLRSLEETLARETREAWEGEVRRALEQTEDLESLAIEVRGDHATVTTPDGLVIELVREAEEWRVLDVRAGSR